MNVLQTVLTHPFDALLNDTGAVELIWLAAALAVLIALLLPRLWREIP